MIGGGPLLTASGPGGTERICGASLLTAAAKSGPGGTEGIGGASLPTAAANSGPVGSEGIAGGSASVPGGRKCRNRPPLAQLPRKRPSRASTDTNGKHATCTCTYCICWSVSRCYSTYCGCFYEGCVLYSLRFP